MRTADTMTTARDNMAATIDKISALLPDDETREQFSTQSRVLLGKADEAIRTQTKLESGQADVRGDRYVKPQPTEGLGPMITFERKGDEIHYHRHDSTGALQTLAFIDSGKQLDIRDWNNPDSVNAALKVASQKWETLSVTGTDVYKETVARLAAEHGYTITNPEMQSRINELRAEFAASRARATEGQAQTEMKAAAESGAVRPESGETEAAAQGVTPTAAERELRLQNIRGRVEREAEREADEANRAKRAHETNVAEGTERTPFRSPTEAQSAREAERAVDNNVHREIPADPARQSQQMQTLRDQQSRVLQQEQEQRRVDQENAERINRDLSQPRRPESQGEGR